MDVPATSEDGSLAWEELSPADIEAACTTAGKTTDAWQAEFVPAMMAVVRSIEEILRAAPDRTDTRDFRAENILRIQNGAIYVKIFTCVNGLCHVPAERPLALGVHSIRERGWKIQFDFEERRRPTS